MDSLNFIGKKVIKKDCGVFSVISVNFENGFIIKLDSNLSFDIKKAISKGILRFEDDEFQEKVKEKLELLEQKHINEPKKDEEYKDIIIEL